VGVHLALTSEWDNVKWRPLTSAPSLVDQDGYFFAMVQPRPGFPLKTSIRESDWSIAEIERELRAQLALAKRHIPQASTPGTTWGSPVRGGAGPGGAPQQGARAGGARGSRHRDGRPVYESRDTGAVKAETLAAKLETLGPGLWLHIDHAATDDPEMRAYGHLGYEWVAADRSAVLEAWTSPRVREVITRRRIKLTNYRDLARP
jgi:hypothetical protein